MNNDTLLDMDGHKIEFGHILAVRYSWNSYVGVARCKGLCAESKDIDKAFFSAHKYSDKATYQIIGHVDKTHKDYNENVHNWYFSENSGNIPVKLRVYDNLEA